MPPVPAVIPPQLIERRIYLFRGQRVMLDADLAGLNQAVRRNPDRFPDDVSTKRAGGRIFEVTICDLKHWARRPALSAARLYRAWRGDAVIRA